MKPITRIERYLAYITRDEDSTGIDDPIIPVEMYLAKIAGVDVAIPDRPITRVEMYLAKIAGEDEDIPDRPITRIEMYLAAIAGEEIEVPIPITRVEKYLYAWVNLGPAWEIVTITGVSPLALQKALQQPIRSLTQFGKCTQPAGVWNTAITQQGKIELRRLPREYTELEYVVFDSTQELDTGFIPNNNSRIESKCYRTGSECWFYGASSSNPRVTLYHSSSGTSRWGNQSRGSFGFAADTEYTIIQDKNGLTINGVTTAWNSGTAGDFTCDRSLTIGNCHGSTSTRYFAGNLYYFKIYDNGVLVRDYLPVKRNSDDALGLYDRVNGTFLTASGFTAGANATPTPNRPMDLWTNNGVIKARHQSGLPLRFKRVEYIASSGTQYITSSVKSVRNGTFFLDFQMTEVPSSGFPTIWGAMSAGSDYKVVFGSGSQKLYNQCGNGAGFVNTIEKDLNRHTVTVTTAVDTVSVDVDGEVFEGSYTITEDTTYALSFFARNRYDGTSNYAKLKLYEAWHKNAQGEYDFYGLMVQDTVTNEYGIYDLVSDTFLGNEGTGAFTGGADVPDPVEIYIEAPSQYPTLPYIAASATDAQKAAVAVDVATAGGNTWGAITTQNAQSVYPFGASGGLWYAAKGSVSENDIETDSYGAFYTLYPLDQETITVGGETWTVWEEWQFDDGAVASGIPTFESTTAAVTAFASSGGGETMTVSGSGAEPQTITKIRTLFAAGGYKDTEEFIAGIHTRRIGVKVLDGTEEWTKSGNLFYADIATDALQSTHGCYCTHFKGVATDASANYDDEIKVGTNLTQTAFWTRVQAYPVVGTYSNVAAFKAFLASEYAAGTPVIVLYPLATETTEQTTAYPQLRNKIYNVADATAEVSDISVTFTTGEQTIPNPYSQLPIVCNNGVLKARHQSGLPLGYQKLEYIEGNGNQYIDTGFYFDDPSTDTFVIDFMRTAASTGTMLYGTRVAYKNNGYCMQFQNTGATYIQWGDKDTGLGNTNAGQLNVRYSATRRGNYYEFNGASYSMTDAVTPTQSYPLYFFCVNNGGTAGQASAMRIYGSTDTNAQGVVKMNVVPAKRLSDNELGLYDIVRGVFLPNQGSGSFTAGAAVDDPIEIYEDGTPEVLTVCGKNLFDKAAQSTQYFYGNDGSETDATSTSVNEKFVHSAKIPCKPNTAYTLSGTRTVAGNAFYYKVTFWDVDGNFLSYQNPDTVAQGAYVRTVTTPADCYFIAFNSFINDTDVMLELGSTPTDYEAFTAQTVTDIPMLLQVGGYKDTEELIEGLLTHKIGVKVFDGTENWAESGASNIYYLGDSTFLRPIAGRIAPYCTHYVGSDAVNADMPDYSIKLTGASGYSTGVLGIKDSTCANVAALKVKLANLYAAGTPVIVLYPLATETTEQTTPHALNSYNGTTIVEAKTNVDPVTLRVEYVAEAS